MFVLVQNNMHIVKNFPENFPENYWKNSRKIAYIFSTNTMLQSENHVFYYCKSNGNPVKLRGKFRGNFRNVKNSWKNFLR